MKTWPRGSNGLFALRDFEIKNKEKLSARVTTYWMILDKKTRRPKRLEDYGFIHSDFEVDPAFDRQLEKIHVKGEWELLDSRRVYSSDIDVNGHVNNATYVRWMMDAYAANNHTPIKELEINFIRELFLNDVFEVLSIIQNGYYYYMIRNEKGQEVCKLKLNV
jgi:acyl-ACP thioesterase